MFSIVMIISLVLSTTLGRPVPREDFSNNVGNSLVNKQPIVEKVLAAYQNGDNALDIFKNTLRDDVMDGIAEGICQGSIAPLIASLIAPAISTTGTVAIQKLIEYFSDEANNWSEGIGRRINYEIQPINIEGRGSYLMLSSTNTKESSKISAKKTTEENASTGDLANSNVKRVNQTHFVPSINVETVVTTHKTEAYTTTHSSNDNLDTNKSIDTNTYSNNGVNTKLDYVKDTDSNDNRTIEVKTKNEIVDIYESVNDIDNEIETRTNKHDILEDMNITRLNNVYLIPFSNDYEMGNEDNMSVEDALKIAMMLRDAAEKSGNKSRISVIHELEEVAKKLKTV